MAWKKFLRLIFTIGITGAAIWFLHRFIANGKDGDDILNIYALILVLLTFGLSNKKGKNIDSVKDVTDVISVMVALAVTVELVFGKKNILHDLFNVIKWIEIVLCIAIVYVGVVNGNFLKSLNENNNVDTQQVNESGMEDSEGSNLVKGRELAGDSSISESADIENKKEMSAEGILKERTKI
ncbi:hypothetical protein ACCY16_17685 [Candidatus Pantoea formicae]|uniref:hypothetical protein n=1 Tax=Candidatus Pantoea formicae TaxID=2608355 RepID=UPI003ED888C1